MANQSRNLRMGIGAQLRLPDVREVLDAGFAAHVLDDPDLKDTVSEEIARHHLNRFRRLKPRNDTEAAYLFCAEGIVLSLGRGITRRKQEWISNLRKAEETRHLKLKRIDEARWHNLGFNTFTKVLAPALIGLAGFMVSKLGAMMVPEDLAQVTGHKIPTIFVTAFFVLVGYTINYWWFSIQRDLIELQHKVESYHIDIAFRLGVLAEFDVYYKELCMAWKQYTGKRYPNRISYADVMKGDISTKRRLERQRLLRDRSTLWLLRRIARIMRPIRKIAVAETERTLAHSKSSVETSPAASGLPAT